MVIKMKFSRAFTKIQTPFYHLLRAMGKFSLVIETFETKPKIRVSGRNEKETTILFQFGGKDEIFCSLNGHSRQHTSLPHRYLLFSK